MAQDRTQFQDDEQQRQSQELSRRRSHPPLDVPGYEARQFLGAGAYGEVWVAVDQNTGRKVAIKFYTQKSGVDWSLLSREVEKLVFLSADRYVVQLLDVGWDADPPYYVMEYVDGGSLQELLTREGALAVGEAVEMFREIVTGLLHAHGKGVLHCDLKPDNILLDQDRKPRLADFGQSRLSHEQAPALGTLFYMAPEQADLGAVPDARWDVYALGALLYTMLTGAAPYRTEPLLQEIDGASSLLGRLEIYREQIRTQPPPSAHRHLQGVDRDLADIVDRCLAVNPERRFANVQSVLTAIRDRDRNKDRKPLLLLGLLGPLLFLVVLLVFGVSARDSSLRVLEGSLLNDAQEISQQNAQLFAGLFSLRMERYFDQVRDQARDVDFQQLVQQVDDRLPADLLADAVPLDTKRALRETFKQEPLQQQLQKLMERRLQEAGDDVASWFVTNAQGVQLAAGFPAANSQAAGVVSTVGQDFSHRTYFHGQAQDLDEKVHHEVAPLTSTKMSSVFLSKATGTYKVAVSTPIVDDQGTVLGVVALTIELGRFLAALERGRQEDSATHVGDASGDHQFVTLVHSATGVILQHRVLAKIPRDFDPQDYRVDLSRIEVGSPINDYRDPMAELHADFQGDWITTRADVKLHQENGREELTELVVLAQEKRQRVVEPVEQLGLSMARDGLFALLIILLGVVYLWYLVTRAMKDPNEALRRSGGLTVRPSSLQTMETVEMPARMRDKT